MLSRAYRQDLNWLVTEFTTRVEDVAHAIVVSADGVLLIPAARAEV
jgi:predicted regulator of Ras-like GTPase activity (Roadblock/LC7/MglB family)